MQFNIMVAFWMAKLKQQTAYAICCFFNYSKLSIAYCASSAVNFSPCSDVN